jgi:probable phosphoglycerate mutase
MHEIAQQVFLIRHGETEWSLSGQHRAEPTSLTDNGRRLAGRWRPCWASKVLGWC